MAAAREGTRRGVHVALLRGINVGGRNRLPMADLVEMFTEADCTDVRTYIQSGNVVFRATSALARRVPSLIADAIEARFGLTVPVVTRTAAELRKIARDNPFLSLGADPATLQVAFLVARPTEPQVATLDPRRSPPDEFVVRGREVYLRCPNGVARSRLTAAWLDAHLETTSTARNWRTVLQLVELVEAA